MANPDPRMWSRANVIDATTAAARCSLAPATVRGAARRGEIVNAWKPSDDSRVWLMFWDDVIAWRKSRRTYKRNK